ncbi:MAG: hypothetical protein QM811_03450 [Pirellulales bacterium]
MLLNDIGFDQFIADPHAKAADRGILRQREMKDTFEPRSRVVDK